MSRGRAGAMGALAAFGFVLVCQLALIAGAGTDIPIYDQWDVEGRWLYPVWRDGGLGPMDLFRPGNENRMVWTLGLDLALFTWNGQWDPLVQLVANAVIRAMAAAGLGWLVVRPHGGRVRGAILAVIVAAFLPHLAWHNALWGIESHAYFVLGFSLLTLALLEAGERSARRTLAGIIAGVAALLAMSPAALVPVALLGLAALRAGETRRWRDLARQTWPALGLLALALAWRVHVPEHDALRAQNWSQYWAAAGRLLAWPHVGSPLAAVPMNAPLVLLVLARLCGWRQPRPGEDFVVVAGGWAAGIALAAAWTRGGSPELLAGVPSRYVDFLCLLPLANLWCAVALAHEAARRKRLGVILSGTWAVFLVIGWLGLSAEVVRKIIGPRWRDRDAPVRLMQAYQASGDANVFVGQPRLLVPHPNIESVRTVLNDERMRGVLPPSLQPDRPMGPLSRAVRVLLGREITGRPATR